MPAFQIEKGVSRPASKAGRPSKYPFAAMKVGDSFFVPAAAVTMPSLRGATYAASMRLGYKLSIREVDGGFRVWRTYKKP